MPFPPRDHRISLEEGAAMTRRYRSQAGPGAQKANAFHADQVKELLGQAGCAALRIYYGVNANGEEVLVLVGVDKNDRDLTGGTLLEVGFPCPPLCDDGSALNS